MKKAVFAIILILLLDACVKKPSDNPEIGEVKVKTKESVESSTNTAAISKEYKTKTGKSFIVSEEKSGTSVSKVSITTEGFAEVNAKFQLQESDPIARISVTDLNNDGFDEIFIITESVGSGSYATVYGLSSNKDKSVSEITIPVISQSDLVEGAIFGGYQGHDSIYVSKNKLYRKFPIYKEGDNNCCPTGGYRIIQYVLKPGEASWRLEVK